MFWPFQRVGIDSLNDEVYLAHLIHGRGNIETPIRGGTVLLEHGKGEFGLALGDVLSRSEEVRSVVSSTNLAPVSCVIVASCSAKVPRTPQSWHLRPRSSRRPALLSPQRILQTSVEAKRGGRANQVREEATGSESQRTRLVNVLNRLRKKKGTLLKILITTASVDVDADSFSQSSPNVFPKFVKNDKNPWEMIENERARLRRQVEKRFM